jgi:hypothetical protein
MFTVIVDWLSGGKYEFILYLQKKIFKGNIAGRAGSAAEFVRVYKMRAVVG